jgi:glutamate synthase domain-containing protein 3
MDGVTLAPATEVLTFDLSQTPLREVNAFLHRDPAQHGGQKVAIVHPDGAHNLAVGIDAAIEVEIHGHTGYYTAGMNQQAIVTLYGNAGTGVAENMMSGRVHVKGFASVSAGASAHGGLLVIDGDAGLRCGISLKGADIVVGGSVGSFSGFMAQAGRMVICGNAGDALGDSLYEAVIYVRGTVKSLGADAQFEPMTEEDYAIVQTLLDQAGFSHNPQDFKRVASARQLYRWNADANQEY